LGMVGPGTSLKQTNEELFGQSKPPSVGKSVSDKAVRGARADCRIVPAFPRRKFHSAATAGTNGTRNRSPGTKARNPLGLRV